MADLSGDYGQAQIPPMPQPGSNPPLTSPNTTVPQPPNYDGANGGTTTVNTEAMVTFATNIEQLKPMLEGAINDLESVKVYAGGFPNAINLASSVTATGKLRDSTQSVMQAIIDTITDLSAATRKLAADFTKAEELNSLSATDYGKYLSMVNGDLNSLGTGSGDSGTAA